MERIQLFVVNVTLIIVCITALFRLYAAIKKTYAVSYEHLPVKAAVIVATLISLIGIGIAVFWFYLILTFVF